MLPPFTLLSCIESDADGKTMPTETPGQEKGLHRIPKGFSLIELLIVVAIILVIAAIAIPNFLSSRMAANQAAGAETVRTVSTASVAYMDAWNNGYPPSLATLGGVEPGPATCNAALLIDPLVATPPNQKSGYVFNLSPQGPAVSNPPAGCVPGFTAYLMTALPQSPNTGTVSYCSNEPGVIHFDSTGQPIPTPDACNNLPALQ